jgi:hypothetical protein
MASSPLRQEEDLRWQDSPGRSEHDNLEAQFGFKVVAISMLF